MTSQQITLILMAAAGAGLFVAGRYYARKFASGSESSFTPATIISPRGIAALLAKLASWGGALLSVLCLLILIG